MTTEELEKEADEYVTTTGNNDCTIEAYIAGAESRERRIAELETQIEGKENEFKYFSNSFKKKIADLENENAALKERNIKGCENFNETIKEISERLNQKHYQLTKAEELLTMLSTCFSSYAENIFEIELVKEVEQFLEEIDK